MNSDMKIKFPQGKIEYVAAKREGFVCIRNEFIRSVSDGGRKRFQDILARIM